MSIKNIIILVATLLLCAGCRRHLGPTIIEVEDPVRHYMPIVLGNKVNLVYKLYNRGDQPFVASDVQPSCGCISIEDENKNRQRVRSILPPGDSLLLTFQFDGSKNIGYVEHTIRIFGNVQPEGVVELKFDINVVPPADFIPDYEATYAEKVKVETKFVEGDYNRKGYYTD